MRPYNFYFYFLVQPKDCSSPLGNFAHPCVAPCFVCDFPELVLSYGTNMVKELAKNIANANDFDFYFKFRGKLYSVSI